MNAQATFKSAGTGNWTSASTWILASGSDADGIPDANDIVIVDDNGGTVTVNTGAQACAALTVSSSSNGTATLAFSSNTSLTVGGTVSVGGNGLRRGKINMTNGGTLICTDIDVNNTGSTFTYGSGTIVLTADNTLPSSVFTTFNNLTISGGTTTTASALRVNGDLTIASGATFATGNTNSWDITVSGTTSVSGTITLANTDNKIFNGDVVINGGGDWNETAAASVTFAGDLHNDGAFNASTGTHTLSGNGKTISGTSEISIPTIALSGTRNNDGTFSITAATSGIGTLTNAASGVLNIGTSSFTPSLVATANGNTVNYNGTTQTVKNTTYSNLQLSNGGVKTFSSGSMINGNLSISGSAKASFTGTSNTGGTLTLDGYGQNSGTWGSSSSTATYKNNNYFAGSGRIAIGTGSCSTGVWLGVTSTNWATASNWCGSVPSSTTDVIIPSGTLYQPSINSGTTATCRNLTIDNGATLTMANSATSALNISGNFTNNGTLSAGEASIVTFNGSAAQMLTGTTATAFANLVINTSASATTVTNDRSFTTTGDLTVTKGNFVMQATDADYGIAGDLSVAGGATLTHQSDWDTFGHSLNVTGNVAIDGTYSKGTAGRVHMQLRGSGKTIHTGTSSVNILTLNTTGAITCDGTVTIDNNFWATIGVAGGSFSTNGYNVTASQGLISFGGTVNVNGGSLTVSNGLQIGYSGGLGGVLNLSAGTITADALILGSGAYNGVFNHSGGTANLGSVTISATSPESAYICTGTPAINVSGNWLNDGTFTKASGAITFNGTSAISGASSNSFHNVTISGSLTAPAANMNVSGTWTNNGSFEANGGTVTLNGSAQQILAGTAASTFNNLSVSNAAGAALSSNVNVNATLSMTGGNIILGSHNLTMGASASAISGSFSASRMIVASGTGQLRKSAVSNASASYTFPIGDNSGTAEYSPISLSVSGSGYAGAVIGITVIDAKHPNNASTTHYLTRYWNVTQTGISGCSASVTATYMNTSADVSGTLANIKSAHLNGIFSQMWNPWVKGPALSGGTLSFPSAPLTSGQTSYFTGITAAAPTVVVTGGNISVCQGTAVTLTANPTGDAGFAYTWTGLIGGSTTSATATADTTVMGGPNSYSVIVRDGNGIESAASAAVSVTVAAQPAAGTLDPSPAAGVVCDGTNVSATLAGGAGGLGIVNDELEVSLSGGNFIPYISGVPVPTAGQTSVVIRTRRTATGGSCNASGYNTVTWTMATPAVSGTVTGGGVTCSGSQLTLTLSGSMGSIQWQSSSDDVAYTNVPGQTNPTITVTVTGTMYYRAQVSNGGPCPAVNSNSVSVGVGGSTTWDGGAWSNGAPTSVMTAIISGNYSQSANIDACSLTVTNSAVVDIPSGYDVSLNGALTVDAGSSFTLENNANLLQTTSAANSGSVTVKRNSSYIKRQDYTLWSSPVAGQTLLSFSPLTVTSPTSRFYQYNSSTNQYNSIATPGSTTFADAQGYLIRVANNHPSYAWIWTGAFSGTPHNGDYSYTLYNGGPGLRYNLVGNPYPSPISAASFASQNAGQITGILYFWRETNGNPNNNPYCTWSPAGGGQGTFVTNGEASTIDPQGIIQTGQGFFVEGTGDGSVSFHNDMRLANNTNQFFRHSMAQSPGQIDGRIWLNVTNAAGAFCQTAITYSDDATNGYDVGLDGKSIVEATTDLYSLVEGQKLAIQARASFTAQDIVPVAFKATTAGDYTIAIDHTDGIFAAGQGIYLRDNLTGGLYDITSSGYGFTSEAGTFEGRFEVLYQNQLGVHDPGLDNQVVIYKQGDGFTVSSGAMTMDNLKVYDIRGRLLTEEKAINASQASFGAALADQVLIVRITGVNGEVAVRKVVR